jgi:hypothetical protein
MVLFSCVVQLVYAVSPEKISDHDQRVAPLVFFAIALFMVIQFFVQILPEFKPYAFADDWIYSKPLDFKSFSQWVDFAFSQHVDHQKYCRAELHHGIHGFFDADICGSGVSWEK